MYIDSKISKIRYLISFLLKFGDNVKSDFKYKIQSSDLKKLLSKYENFSNKEILEIAYRHKLIEFLYENQFIKSHMKDLHNYLENSYKKIFLKNLKNIHHTKSILKIFKQEKIQVIVLKGITTSLITKGYYSSRMSSDLDLFIDKNDLTRAFELLNNNNYLINHNFLPKKISNFHKKLMTFFLYEINFCHKTKDCNDIDLHWKLTNYNKNLPNFSGAWTKSKLLVQNNFEFKSLNKYDFMKYLCAHSAKDKWMFLNNLLDIHFLAKKISKLKLKELNNIKEVKISLYAAYLLTKDDHYNFSKTINKLDSLYIKLISSSFQNFSEGAKGFKKSNIYINFLNFCHEIYLTNSAKDIFLILTKIFWYSLPHTLKKNYRKFS